MFRVEFLESIFQHYEKYATFKNGFFPSMPIVAASDESVYTLNTANIYLFQVNNRNTKRYEICSLIKTPKRLYVIIMSRTRFRVNLYSIVVWMSRNSWLKTGAISEA